MKSAWRENPDGPKYWPSEATLQAEKDMGLTRIYFPLMRRNPTTGRFIFNDLQISASYCNDITTHFEFGIYYHPEAWDGDRNATTIVNKMHNAYVECGKVSAVMWDIEDHNCDNRIVTIIDEWRAKHPKGPIAWTMEPFQGGWMTKELVSAINSDINMVVVPQNFYSKMEPAGLRNGKNPKQELEAYGFASNRVKLFYDGMQPLPANWDGTILSEERLPSYKLS